MLGLLALTSILVAVADMMEEVECERNWMRKTRERSVGGVTGSENRRKKGLGREETVDCGHFADNNLEGQAASKAAFPTKLVQFKLLGVIDVSG